MSASRRSRLLASRSTVLLTAVGCLVLLLACVAGCPRPAESPNSPGTPDAGTPDVLKTDEQKNAGDAAPGDSGSSASSPPSNASYAAGAAAPAASDKPASDKPPTADKPGETVDITFDDLLLNMQQDIVYRPWMLTERAQSLDGRRIRLTGYMHGGVSQSKNIKEFVLLKNTECKFGPGGQADHLLRVYMTVMPGASYSTSALQVEGQLKINPYQGPDGNTWSVFDLTCDSVKPAARK